MHKELTSIKAKFAGQYLSGQIRQAIRQSWKNRSTSTAAVMFAGAVAAGIC